MCKALLGDIVYLSPLEEPEKGPYSMEVPTNLLQTDTIGGENEDETNHRISHPMDSLYMVFSIQRGRVYIY